MQISAIDRWIRETEGLSSLSRKEIEALQLEKLNLLLAKEKRRNGFYRNLPLRLNRLDELSALPFTDSSKLEKYGAQMVLVSQSEISKVATDMTSGTTGAAKRLFYTQYDRERTRGFFAAGLSEMVLPDEKVLVCMQSDGAEGLLTLICDAVKRLRAVPIPFGSGRKYRDFFEINRHEAPECYIGMPVPLLSRLRYAALLGIDLSLKKALLSGDACAASVFFAIETLLDRKPLIHYGLREGGLGVAVNCQAFNGMHIRENDILAEIVDPDGFNVRDGEFGELVITTIGMDAMPLIRYKTGDKTRIIPEECRCKSRLKKLDHVLRMGWEQEIVTLDEILFAFPQIVDFKASWSLGGLNIEIAGGSEFDLNDITKKLEISRLLQRIKIVPHLLTESDTPYYTGKRRIVSSC